jgi:hypothetical protein
MVRLLVIRCKVLHNVYCHLHTIPSLYQPKYYLTPILLQYVAGTYLCITPFLSKPMR